MPISVGIPGFELSQEERISALVAAVGGPVKAAAITGRTRTHIDNMRKAGAALRLDDLILLAIEAGVTLDWVATGYDRRPDLPAHNSHTAPSADQSGGLIELKPLAPGRASADQAQLAVSANWLHRELGLAPDQVRIAATDDDGMAPLITKGAQVIATLESAPLRSGIYLLVSGNELLARRLNRTPDGGLELSSDTDANWRYTITEPQLPTLHRIVWCGRTL